MGLILGIGGVTVDRVFHLSRMPGWGGVEHADEYEVRRGGMVATAMASAARLGGDAEFIGGIGDDEAGGFVRRSLRREGVKDGRMRVISGGRTAQSIVLVNRNTGERTIIHHRGVQEGSFLGDGEIDISGADFLHLDGYWFDTALAAARRAKAGGTAVIIDPSRSISREKGMALFPLADFIIPSKKFASQWTGEDDPAAAAHKLFMEDTRAVIITSGETGCHVFDGKRMHHVPAFPVDAVDTTGAGDAFHGGFIYALSVGKGIHAAAVYASAVAALKCARTGCRGELPGRDEVERFMASHEDLR